MESYPPGIKTSFPKRQYTDLTKIVGFISVADSAGPSTQEGENNEDVAITTTTAAAAKTEDN